MKKSIFYLILVFIITFTSACGAKPAEEEGEKKSENNYLNSLDVNYLSNLRMDLSNAHYIGIQNKSERKNLSINNINISDFPKIVTQKDEKEEAIEIELIRKEEYVGALQDNKGNIINQDIIKLSELPVLVNKLYVNNQYTFVQLVARVDKSGLYSFTREDGSIGSSYIELRDKNLVVDENGVTDFDKRDYKTDDLHYSFVIDNGNGYLYELGDIEIAKFEFGFIQIADDQLYYDYRVNDKEEFVIYSLFQNKNIQVDTIFRDKYGNIYIKNNIINTYDSNLNIIYYIDDYYLLSKEKIVLYVKKSNSIGIVEFKIMVENNQKRDIITEDSLTFSDKISWYDDKISSTEKRKIKVEKGFVYYIWSRNSIIEYSRYNALTLEYKGYFLGSDMGDAYAIGFNLKYALLYVKLDSEFSLYYLDIDHLFEAEVYNEDGKLINNQVDYLQGHNLHLYDIVMLLENCNYQVKSFYFPVEEYETCIFTINSLSGTTSYIVVESENGAPELANLDTYIAPPQKEIILQPLR